MADISQYLDLIDKAVKGKEVRDSIRDAIQAINLENERLNESVRDSVQDIIDSAIGTSTAVDRKIAENGFFLTFDLMDGVMTCNHSLEDIEDYINKYPSVRKIEDIPTKFMESSLAGDEEIIGKDEYWTAHYHPTLEHWYVVYFTIESGDKLYFNYKSFNIRLDNTIGILDDYRYLINGSSSGGGDSEAFLLQFTLDSDKNVTCNRSSAEAEAFMDSKYGAGNWIWNDFWKEAVITLYNEYEAWDYEAGAIESDPEVVMALSHIDLVRGYLYFSTNYVREMAGVNEHRTCVSFEWDLDDWTTSDHASNVEFVIYGGLEAGPGIDISANEHLPGSGILTNVISFTGELTQYEYAKFNKLGGIVLPFLVNTNYKQTIDFTNDHFMSNNIILGSEYNELMHITQYSDKYYIKTSSGGSNAQLSLALTGRHTFEHDPSNSVVNFDGDLATSIDFSNYTNEGEHYVLGARNGGSLRAEPTWKHSNIKVHEYTLTDTTNDDILCHLVPAKYSVGGIVLHSGLYDTVSKQFYSCDGMTVGGNVINS